MKLHLERFSLGVDETEGVLEVDGEYYATIEQPWRNNSPQVSCIPLGEYELLPTVSPRFGPTWVLENKALGVGAREGGAHRSLILIHPANWASQLKGCIAPGLSRSFGFDARAKQVRPMVSGSKNAFSKIRAALEAVPGPHTILITQKVY